jgi:hypothetical protein
LWWDWLVINDEHGEYVQQEFESAMTWAQTCAYEVVVLWPRPSDALAYMARPWCLSEILACISRGGHVIYSEPRDFWLSKDGASSHVIFEKIVYPLMLAVNEAYVATLYSFSALFFMEASPDASIDNNMKDRVWNVTLCFFLSYCVMFSRYHLNNYLGAGKIDNYELIFPVDLIEYLTNNSNWKMSTDERRKLVKNLCEVGHLTGVMYDLGDTIGCGALLGYKEPWKFAFAQATMKIRDTIRENAKTGNAEKKKPLLVWQSETLKRKEAFSGRNASWLTGVNSEKDDENEAVLNSFSGVEMLWLSKPAPRFAGNLMKMILTTPIAPLQCICLTTSLDRPLLVGEGQIRMFYSLLSILTMATLPIAVQFGFLIAILLSLFTMIPHFMMAAGYLTLVSRSKLYIFCSLINIVQCGFLSIQWLILAENLIGTNSGLFAFFWFVYSFWCLPHIVIAVVYLFYYIISTVFGIGQNTSFRQVC